jgi:hypothetical protein
MEHKYKRDEVCCPRDAYGSGTELSVGHERIESILTQRVAGNGIADAVAMLHAKFVSILPTDVVQRLIRLNKRLFVRNVPNEQIYRFAELDCCPVRLSLGTIHTPAKVRFVNMLDRFSISDVIYLDICAVPLVHQLLQAPWREVAVLEQRLVQALIAG